MPELPEILLRARELDAELAGRTIADATFYQPKCLNLPPGDFTATLRGQRVHAVRHHGKWLLVRLDTHYLLINLGMGGEILYHSPAATLPEKVQAVLHLSDEARISLHFWWFGYIHLVADERLAEHAMTVSLGIDPLSEAFTPQALGALLAGRRKRVKTILLDQTQIAGIGNMYAHDILFRARIHPDRPACSLRAAKVAALHAAIQETLQSAIAQGGAFWEQNLYGVVGGFDMAHLLVGYKEGQPCPACGTPILKVKTGATSGFLCPTCQILEHDCFPTNA
ncbi:MAG: Fpg/Nei family DNA glycosylase [Anaerolineae bacterium]